MPAAAAPGNPPAAQPAPEPAPQRGQWSQQVNECVQNEYWISLAAVHYASQHEWRLPPDLGATLPYLLRYDQQAGKLVAIPPAEAAKYYICPQDQVKVQVPSNPTPEWVNQNTSYGYLGGPDVNMDALTPKQLDDTVMLYEKAAGTHPEYPEAAIGWSLGQGRPMLPVPPEMIAESRAGAGRDTRRTGRSERPAGPVEDVGVGPGGPAD